MRRKSGKTGLLFSALSSLAALVGVDWGRETLGEKTKRIVVEDRREILWGEKRDALRLWSVGVRSKG